VQTFIITGQLNDDDSIEFRETYYDTTWQRALLQFNHNWKGIATAVGIEE